MFYIGVKRGIEYAGWSEAGFLEGLPLPGAWFERTKERTLDIVGQMREGRVEPAPADRGICRFCDARDVCRVAPEAFEALEEGA